MIFFVLSKLNKLYENKFNPVIWSNKENNLVLSEKISRLQSKIYIDNHWCNDL